MTRADRPKTARAVPAQQSQALTGLGPAVHDRPPHTLAGRAEAAAIQLRPSTAAQAAPRGGISAIVAVLVHAMLPQREIQVATRVGPDVKVVGVFEPGIAIKCRP